MKKDEAKEICRRAWNETERMPIGDLIVEILDALEVLALVGPEKAKSTYSLNVAGLSADQGFQADDIFHTCPGVCPPDLAKAGKHILRSANGRWLADWMPLAAQWSLDGLLVSPEALLAAEWRYETEAAPAAPAAPPRPPVMEPERPEIAGFYLIQRSEPDVYGKTWLVAQWVPERRHWVHEGLVTSEEAAARGWHSPKLIEYP